MRIENILYSLKYISELFISKNNFLCKTGNIKSICMVHMIYHNITSLIWPMTEHCGTSSQVIFKICLLFCSSLSPSISLSLSLSLSLFTTHLQYAIALLIFRCIFFNSYMGWWPLSLFSYSWVHERSDSCLIRKSDVCL